MVSTWFLGAAIGGGLYGLLTGLFVPSLIARIPEPELSARREDRRVKLPGAASAEADLELPAAAGPGFPAEAEPAAGGKQPYAVIARRPGLRWECALATAAVGALLSGRVGWVPELAFLLYLAPVGVALAVVDWRTRLLPTRVIAPSYLAVLLLVLTAATLSRDWAALGTAAAGWLLAGGGFFALWYLHPRGMGYGDVRLAGLLGIALGYLGWPELVTGMYSAFLLGGVGGLLLSTFKIVDRKAYPFGPFLLAGALLGVLAGPYFAAWYA